MPAAGVFRHCSDHHSCIPHNGKTVGNHGGGTELCTFLLYFVCFIYNDSNFCDSEKEKRNCKRNLIFFHKKVPEPGLYLAEFRYLSLSFTKYHDDVGGKRYFAPNLISTNCFAAELPLISSYHFFLTVILQVFFIFPQVTVMVAFPAFLAVITPFLLTVATFLLEVVYFTVVW